MSKLKLMELIQQDIEDIKELLDKDKYGWLKDRDFKRLARASILNLQNHLEDFIQN